MRIPRALGMVWNGNWSFLLRVHKAATFLSPTFTKHLLCSESGERGKRWDRTRMQTEMWESHSTYHPWSLTLNWAASSCSDRYPKWTCSLTFKMYFQGKKWKKQKKNHSKENFLIPIGSFLVRSVIFRMNIWANALNLDLSSEATCKLILLLPGEIEFRSNNDTRKRTLLCF